MKKNVLAFDFGASSGRAIVGKYHDGKLDLEEIHRFPNQGLTKNGTLYWDIKYLFDNIQESLSKSCEKYSIDSIGIDTWGVDFGILDEQGNLLENPVNYRDQRTKGMLEEAQKYMSLKKIYQNTGNQLMEINTLFQLLALKTQEPETFAKVDKFLFMPDLLNYLLTGKKAAERSIASTSQLVNPQTNHWDPEIIQSFDLPEKIFAPLVSAGNNLGTVKSDLTSADIEVINVCEHDTASAVVSVPCNQKFLFVSCGTWSLVGTELDKPIINEKAYKYNLTNEKGINDTTRFLKNCTGLWIIQEVKRNFESLGRKYSFSEIDQMALAAEPFKCLIDTDHPMFVAPGDMIGRIQKYGELTNQEIPRTDGEIARCVYESLAMKYKYTFLEIIDAVEAEFDTVNIVGGGAQSKALCQMVANASNMRVSAGPVEATAIGNISVQLLSAGIFKDLQEMREWIKEFSNVQFYFPTAENKNWDKQFSKYQTLLKKEVGEIYA